MIEIGYELGDIETLKVRSNIELTIGKVFKSRGQMEGQLNVFWEVLRKELDGRYVCKVVGINSFGKAK
ncbi:hypothetical protein GC093_19155 [Paenibacillus sp. LMG 31456]|uniref:Uncharacterized protein n=1 Tax=Paenibacillus foliorum TaxID=2654974 RepID=A0A972GWY7_9BACL|nr:hypothetical protein [Paenibacillus foliorum]NOU95327.1 hypothetical protein [Paenibacillus foliorum]